MHGALWEVQYTRTQALNGCNLPGELWGVKGESGPSFNTQRTTPLDSGSEHLLFELPDVLHEEPLHFLPPVGAVQQPRIRLLVGILEIGEAPEHVIERFRKSIGNLFEQHL